MPSPVSTGIGLLAGAAGLVTNAINNSKAKKEAKILEATRPKRKTSPLVQQELDLAESELSSGGMSAKAERAYNQLQDKQFSSSLGAILRGGGSVNNVGDVFGAGEEGRLRIALLNDQIRMQQLDRLSRARNQSAEEADKNFMFNQFAPWADKAQANAAARKGATEGIWNSVDTIAGLGMDYFGQKYNENKWNSYFNQGAGGGTPNGANRQAPMSPSAARGNQPLVLPTSSAGTGMLNTKVPGMTTTVPANDDVYSYNWTPQMEQEQFKQDFGLIYQ